MESILTFLDNIQHSKDVRVERLTHCMALFIHPVILFIRVFFQLWLFGLIALVLVGVVTVWRTDLQNFIDVIVIVHCFGVARHPDQLTEISELAIYVLGVDVNQSSVWFDS